MGEERGLNGPVQGVTGGAGVPKMPSTREFTRAGRRSPADADAPDASGLSKTGSIGAVNTRGNPAALESSPLSACYPAFASSDLGDTAPGKCHRVSLAGSQQCRRKQRSSRLPA